MAAIDAGSELQSAIQAAVQPKLMENGWVPEESDTTLSEYVAMMIVNGKDLRGVQSELGTDLLGVGEDDPAVSEFARWLFEKVNELSAPKQPEAGQQQQHSASTAQDSQMEDTPASVEVPYVNPSHFYRAHGPGAYARNMRFPYTNYHLRPNVQPLTYSQYSPTGPRSMRNGGAPRGRGSRMLRQMQGSMERSNDLPEGLRRIKGAAGGHSGRINTHANRDGPPRGPKNNLANGMQRMMNGGRGGHAGSMSQVNPAMGNNMNSMQNNGTLNQQQQMQFMQMMEASAQMMAQVLQQNGAQAPKFGTNQRGNHRGSNRGGQRGGRGGSQKLHAVDGKLPDGPLPGSNNADSGMDIDGQENKSDKFSTMCRFNLSCTNPTCDFAHQSPAAPPNAPVDLADTCAHGAACTNFKCTGRHPSPAQRSSHKQEVDCKFYPNCTNPSCPFRHPTAKPCRNGADCTTPNCTFAHSAIVCRYNPCLNPQCPFKHSDGQKRGNFEDKVWKSNGEDGSSSKAERFAGFSNQNDGQEELIIPGQQNSETTQEQSSSSQPMETQIAT